MIDKFYFVVCVIGLMVTCSMLGWSLHETEVERKKNRRVER